MRQFTRVMYAFLIMRADKVHPFREDVRSTKNTGGNKFPSEIYRRKTHTFMIRNCARQAFDNELFCEIRAFEFEIPNSAYVRAYPRDVY